MFNDIPTSTVVYSSDGRLLGARVASDGQWRFPPSDTVPDKFARALIEYEDRTFRSHCGISLRGIGRALLQNIRNGRVVSGASTLSMQVIRLERRKSRNIFEKIIEAFMATRLEARYSKDEILALYASYAPFGGNVVGLGAALWRYLGNDGAEMSWAEAATLAVLQNAPAKVHPSRNRDMLLARRNRLLKRLLDKGEIDHDEYSLAIEEPLIDLPYAMPRHAVHLVENLFQSKKGQAVVTTIDYAVQEKLEMLADWWQKTLSVYGAADIAIIVSDIVSGNIIAYCENADLNSERPGRWVDIASAPRSSGSLLKPLLYCAALQDGIIMPASLLPDVPTDFGGFAPKNFDGNFSGAVPADEALIFSLNVPMVNLLQNYGVRRFVGLLRACGINTLNRNADSYGLSLILGGAEVSLVDVVNCYTSLARQYLYGSGDFPLTDRGAIYACFDAMSKIVRPDGLDRMRSSSASRIAWKTGTSYGARDAWAVGLNSHYSVGVWVGNADGSSVPGLTGATMATPVMHDVFAFLPDAPFFDPPDAKELTLVKTCRHSGYRAGADCAEVSHEYVPLPAAGSTTCPFCKKIAVSADGLRRVNDGSEDYILKSYFVLPGLQNYYYHKQHADHSLPPADRRKSVEILYPTESVGISLNRMLSGRKSPLVCKALAGAPDATLFWDIDGFYLGKTRDIHSIPIDTIASGRHTLTVADNFGTTANVTFTVH